MKLAQLEWVLIKDITRARETYVRICVHIIRVNSLIYASLFFLLLLGIAPIPPPTAYIGLSPRGTDLRRADQKIEFAPLNRASQHAQPLGEGFFFNGCSTFGVTSLLTPHLNTWAGCAQLFGL